MRSSSVLTTQSRPSHGRRLGRREHSTNVSRAWSFGSGPPYSISRAMRRTRRRRTGTGQPRSSSQSWMLMTNTMQSLVARATGTRAAMPVARITDHPLPCDNLPRGREKSSCARVHSKHATVGKDERTSNFFAPRADNYGGIQSPGAKGHGGCEHEVSTETGAVSERDRNRAEAPRGSRSPDADDQATPNLMDRARLARYVRAKRDGAGQGAHRRTSVGGRLKARKFGRDDQDLGLGLRACLAT
jgi:hypothetical protein